MSPTDMTVESKACHACARAKRKCERQIPVCSRCQSRGTRCEYPTAAHEPFDLPQDRHQPVAVSEESLSHLLFGFPEDMMPVDDFASHSLDTIVGNSGSLQEPNPKPQSPPLPWYLEKESWDIDHLASHSTAPFCSTILKSYNDNIRAWLKCWVETGGCPFIHHRTYTHHIPRCVQDAYTALSTYQNIKESNRAIVMALLEQRLKQLLADQPRPPTGAGGDEDAGASLNTFEHLARVHALLTYQIVCLHDGDIRLRHVAETQIPTLNSWLRQLVSSAQHTAAQGPEAFISPLVTPPGRQQDPPAQVDAGGHDGDMEYVTLTRPILPPEDMAWYAWLFAETIRRTWLVASSVQTIYLTLQVLWAPCPGGLPFTTRKGAFEAASSFSWAAHCDGHRQGTDFARRHKHRLFEECRPEDLDEFTTRLLEINYGTERMERWRFEK